MTTPTIPRLKMPKHSARGQRVDAQRGIVLIISLIMIVVISLLAVASMRNAASSESVAGNVRTTELATQSAEIALRHCESSALRVVRNICGDTTSAEATYATTVTVANISTTTLAAQWQSISAWDGASATALIVPPPLVGNAVTFKRPPECMVESLTGATPVCTPASFVITARGFGPEVARADASRSRPQGTEVWLQSTIELN